jgi:hypothetical protein
MVLDPFVHAREESNRERGAAGSWNIERKEGLAKTNADLFVVLFLSESFLFC